MPVSRLLLSLTSSHSDWDVVELLPRLPPESPASPPGLTSVLWLVTSHTTSYYWSSRRQPPNDQGPPIWFILMRRNVSCCDLKRRMSPTVRWRWVASSEYQCQLAGGGDCCHELAPPRPTWGRKQGQSNLMTAMGLQQSTNCSQAWEKTEETKIKILSLLIKHYQYLCFLCPELHSSLSFWSVKSFV